MRTLRAVVICMAFATAADARAITIAWSPVGNPGNAADPATGYGAIPYSYSISTFDVTVSQYVAFLNAKDVAGINALGLYNSAMSDDAVGGGVIYDPSGSFGHRYAVATGDGNLPINDVNYFDALRFANWVNNGQGGGSTETGAYTLLGDSPIPSNANDIERNPTAKVALPNQDEWYKAAYYNPANGSYFSFPTSSNTLPVGSAPTSAADHINGNDVVGNLTNVGAYTGTTSPYGVFDMGGNVTQWTEAIEGNQFPTVRGGSWLDGTDDSRSSDNLQSEFQSTVADVVGFRLVLVPEPSSAVLALIAAGMLPWRRRILGSANRRAV